MQYPAWNSFGIAIGVLTIMISIGGISIGIGYATNNRKLKDFGRDELNQCVINGMLIGGLAALFLPSGIMTGIIASLTSGVSGAQCPSYLTSNPAICFANSYLVGSGYSLGGSFHSSILSQATMLIIGLLSLNTILGLIASLKISLLAVSFSLAQVLSPVLSQIQFFIKALTTVSISVLVQSSILSAIASTAITILLPAGIVLRTFYPTRQLGGFTIALVFGLYVIFPATYLLNAYIINTYSISLSNSTITSLSSSASSLKTYVSSLSPSNSIASNPISNLYGYLSPITSLISQFITAILNYISYFAIAAFILPAFSVVLTSISVREFASLFGSEMTFNIFDVV